MNAGFVRFGGIAIFLSIAWIVLLIIIGAAAPQLLASKVATVLFSLVLYGLGVIAYLATMALWSGLGKRGGNIPIIFLIVILILFFIISLFGGAGPMAPGGTGGNVLGIIALILMVLLLVAAIWFSIYCMIAGSVAGGVWKATGILYLLVIVLMILMAVIGGAAVFQAIQTGSMAPGTGGMAVGAGIVGIVLLLVMLAGAICHGIGLIMGAAKLQQG